MPKIKRRTFSGSVCEQEVFTVAPNKKDLSTAEPKQWFKTEEERARHEWLAARRRCTQNINATYSPESLYSTLTMDNDHEVHTYDEFKRMRDNYYRRLKRAYPDADISIFIGRGKTTNRFHMHMLSNGLSKETISEKWTAGSVVRIENLRAHNIYDGVDHGQDYTGLAHYLFDHWEPEQGCHHCKQSKSVRRPDREEPTIPKRDYSESKPPRAPKGYTLVECKRNDFGYQYFKYVKIPGSGPPPGG